MTLTTQPPSLADEIDAAFGNPWDESNPLGHRSALDADERQELFEEGERRLDAVGLSAAFVPRAEGGGLTRLDQLAATLRTVWRRDPCLGQGYGLSSFLAGVGIWSAGDDEQRARAAALLLDRSKIACCGQEPTYDGDLCPTGFEAVRRPGGWLLSGGRHSAVNFRRAEALVVFALTDPARADRGHSQFLIEKSSLPAGALRYTERVPSAGMRGAQLSGGVFTNCPIPDRALLGEAGAGLAPARRATQLTCGVLPSVCVGPLDTALRAGMLWALEPSRAGRTAAEQPRVSAALTRAFTALLAADAFSTVALRALHLAPEQASAYASASSHVAIRLICDAFAELRGVLGARGAVREGPYAIFQKLARDIAQTVGEHDARNACMVTVLPRLPRLARRSWLVENAVTPELFDPDSELPALEFGPLGPDTARTDALISALTAMALAEAGGTARPLARLARLLLDQTERVRDWCAALGPRDLAKHPSVAALEAVDGYTVLLAAAAAWGVHRADPARLDEVALTAVLDLLARRLHPPSVLTEAEHREVRERLWHELLRRVNRRQLLDLTARQVPG